MAMSQILHHITCRMVICQTYLSGGPSSHTWLPLLLAFVPMMQAWQLIPTVLLQPIGSAYRSVGGLNITLLLVNGTR